MKYKQLLVLGAVLIIATVFAVNYVSNSNKNKEDIISDIPNAVYTQECMPRTIYEKGVTRKCFDSSNSGDTKFCTPLQIKIIEDYYTKDEYKTDKYKDTDNYCAPTGKLSFNKLINVI